MTNKDDLIPKPEQIKTPIQELQLMANLADMPHFQILKRWARRYTEQLKNKSFRLNPEDEHFLVKHTRHIEQAVGMELLIKAVEDARKQLNQEDNAS